MDWGTRPSLQTGVTGAFSLAGTVAGGWAGIAIGGDAVAGLVASAAGTTMGLISGVAAIEAMKQLPPNPGNAFARRFKEIESKIKTGDEIYAQISNKMRVDFEKSPLLSSSALKEAAKDLKAKLPEGNKLSPKIKRDLQNVIDNYNPSTESILYGKPDQASIDNLIKRERPLRINCSSIEPAIVVSLMYAEKEFGLPLEIDFSAINGRAQIERSAKALDSDTPFDFIFSAVAPFIYYTSKGAVGAFQHEYSLVLPVHLEGQLVLRRKTSRSEVLKDLTDITRIKFLGRSSGAEQFDFFGIDEKRLLEPDEQKLFDLPTISDNIDETTAIIMYNPAADSLLGSGNLISLPRYSYDLWIGLFENKKLQGKDDPCEAFVECFVTAWCLLRKNPSKARDILLDRSDLREAFARSVFKI